jgi:hypothetical protein
MNKDSLMLTFALFAFGLGPSCSISIADDNVHNLQSTQRIPGQEVVTSEGRKARVWSTEGPVPVSQAPEPFAAKDQGIPASNVEIVVEEKDRKTPKNSKAHDSFDLD